MNEFVFSARRVPSATLSTLKYPASSSVTFMTLTRSRPM
jgi:hypothetical protein